MRLGRSSTFAAAFFWVLIMSSAPAEDPAPKPYQHHSVLVVKRIPDTNVAITELSALRGIEQVFVNRKSRRITFKLSSNATPSALQIWEVAEQLDLEPVR